MKDRWTGRVFQAACALTAALLGNHRWTVLLAIFAVMAMTYGTVYLLARSPDRPRSIRTFLISCSWGASEETVRDAESSMSQPGRGARQRRSRRSRRRRGGT
jgi:hypothetical protein